MHLEIATKNGREARAKSKPEGKTVEVELGGKKVQIRQQAFSTGVVPIPHFLRRFAGIDE
jgi:hypothetical protein